MPHPAAAEPRFSRLVPANEPAFLRDAHFAITLGQTVGSGHFTQLEVPEQVDPMIERFLAVMPGT